MSADRQHRYVGRGTQTRPDNRFDRLSFHREDESDLPDKVPTDYFPDASQTIVSQNESRDIFFRYSVNPYRGCAHGCSYCYARPTHEYLGFDAGLDFETKIMVKHRAPQLLRQWLARDRWVPEPIMFSGVTDCYQPGERNFQLTRKCLEVCWEARQPVMIVTKNALVLRDLDLLAPMAERQLVRVAISVTSLDQSLTRVLEPRTSSPRARLEAIEALSTAGVPAQVMLAPVIPALNDHEIPGILKAAAAHGATSASYVLLRLPQSAETVFRDWLRQHFPHRASAVENRIRELRSGKLNDSRFGDRMRGVGAVAEQINKTFQVFAQQTGLASPSAQLNTSDFRTPRTFTGQQKLF